MSAEQTRQGKHRHEFWSGEIVSPTSIRDTQTPTLWLYSCVTETCTNELTGSHPWYRDGYARHGRERKICSKCQYEIYGWICFPGNEDTTPLFKELAENHAQQQAKLAETHSSSMQGGGHGMMDALIHFEGWARTRFLSLVPQN